MAEQEGKQALIIQLPWTVPQQPNVQTIVLQQPAKTHMELNASTDKTAISSFALSVAIALILGALATWLAYWYGRKSFDLTKQSFDTVIAQIKSSEKIMLESNKLLISSQSELKIRELQISNGFNELSIFREIVSEYYYWAIKVNNESISSIHTYYNLNLTDKQKKEVQEVVRIRVDELNALISKIMVHLDYDKELHNTVRNNLFTVQISAFDLYASIGTEFQNSKTKLNEFVESFGYTQGLLNTLINNEMTELYKEKKAA